MSRLNDFGYSGLGPLRAELFPFYFYDFMFGCGGNNAAADMQGLVVAVMALLPQCDTSYKFSWRRHLPLLQG